MCKVNRLMVNLKKSMKSLFLNELLQIKKKTNNNPIEKQAKDINWQFPSKGTTNASSTYEKMLKLHIRKKKNKLNSTGCYFSHFAANEGTLC